MRGLQYLGNRSQFNSRYHVITNTRVRHQGRITVQGVRSMRLSRVRVKLSWLLKAVKNDQEYRVTYSL